MNKSTSSEVKRGQSISFRIPSDTPDHIIKELQKLKETERRNFSSKIAEFVMQGVSQSHSKDRETITIPLPRSLTKVQKDWLKHEHSEALLGTIMYHLISDPIRSTALLASLNSRSSNIDEALYLQEDLREAEQAADDQSAVTEEMADSASFDDDLMDFDWDSAKQAEPFESEEQKSEENLDDLLGGFLAHMNK
ncbi:hypothetical protein AB1L05_18695 [Cytobacillus horneckiae]|uniref:Uncharacterized protein n=1 Tax=Cytobacillus horneckiae TaxID=549687 RepID=A0A2N0ZDL3_9BACI|nr:hypothetical protein [Cytobacillus horneckiae]MCM3179318.1 hypothetical protein [Cytobacillus horneckiae]MEC1154540.1 hypothetical protein [Cytobacillus horneckiae]MED2937875.1 hypothetical protein [Cytobacillus horneckiae]PKG27594.1 hypothetical protein CWS20_17865 [Cytobacillus horneckiae]